MHATLFVKHTDKLRPTSLSLLLQKSLKKRTGCVAAILLLHDGWQLLVVAYQDEAVDAAHLRTLVPPHPRERIPTIAGSNSCEASSTIQSEKCFRLKMNGRV